MPTIRKRRAPEVAQDPESSGEESQSQPRPNQRRRHSSTPPPDDAAAAASEDAGDDGYGSDSGSQPSAIQPLARKLCRYALSCEYARQPIRRPDINAKVLNPSSGRIFKQVFLEAQNMLRDVFGMEMVELPVKEKVTLQQKRAAQRQGKDLGASNANSNAWVLASTLPGKYRTPDIVGPTAAPTHEQEAAYTALYTFIVSTIYLAGGTIPESKLERYMRRMNADRNTPLGPTDTVLKRLIKDQYIAKVVDRSNPTEDNVEYVVGPRGKIEVGEEGVRGMVRAVYGSGTADLEKKLENSLRVGGAAERDEKGGKGGEVTNGATASSRAAQGRSQRGRRAENARRDEEEDEEEESDEDD
ncbi:uncharacterized protein PV09_07293 [Verruconis gallopava]|uniref:MAGE domain-containing protein n=1 Tax=Verruconis gallopava TaxID=253628 RepID=A0A0D1XGC4_9PEZI|nr:uncharacterized protein PV09_07293 [Verruconis gallopava]KIW01251.1 hypothetical protein PV09_07293 [Verruconis gallopava]